MNLVQLLIFGLYFLGGGYLLKRLIHTWLVDLSNLWIWGLWLLKIITGIVLILIHQHYYPQNDYTELNHFGFIEYQNLLNHPAQFFTDWLHSPYSNKYSGVFQSVGSYWNDLRNTLLSKFIGITNVINRGNIYLNTLIFCWIGFIGHLAFYRLFIRLFPSKKIPIIIGSFLLPSTLFFSSALHKDTIVFTLMGLYLFICFSIIEKKLNVGRLSLMLACLIGLFIFRNFVFVIFLPLAMLWILTEKKSLKAPIVLTAALATLFIFLLISDFYFPHYSPIKILSDKQSDYLALPKTESALELQKLEPGLKSAVQCLPMALNHAFLKPFLWEDGRFLMAVSSIELFLYQLIFVLIIFLHHRSPQTNYPGSIWFLITMAMIMILFAGYISPNVGTLVRYRCLYLPMLVTPMLCVIKWRNFSNRFTA